MAFTADIRPYENSIANRVETAIEAFKSYRARRAAYRQTFDELMALSNRDLNDLGIARTDIAAIAREAANG